MRNTTTTATAFWSSLVGLLCTYVASAHPNHGGPTVHAHDAHAVTSPAWPQRFICCEDECGISRPPWESEGIIQTTPLNNRAERDSEIAAIDYADGFVHWATIRSIAAPQPAFVTYRRFDRADDWESETTIVEGREYDSVAVAAINASTAWVAWVELDAAGSSDIYAQKMVDGRRSGSVVNVSNSTGQDRQLTVDSDGANVWLCWVHDDGSSEIMLSYIDPSDTPHAPVNVSETAATDWAPDLAITSDGTVHVVWDTYLADNYDVLYRSYSQTSGLGILRAIATGDVFQAHANICSDELDRLWVAWEEAQANWAKGLLSNGSSEWDIAQGQEYWDLNAFHTYRKLHLAQYDPVAETLSFPSPSFDEHINERMLALLGNDYPLHDAPFLFRHAGRTYVLFRYAPFNDWDLRWEVYATAIDDLRWYTVEKPASSGGYLYQRSMGVGVPGQIWLSGARIGDGVSGRAYAGNLDENIVTQMTNVSWTPEGAPAVPDPVVRTYPTHQITVDDLTYTTYFGDTHRHTELSTDRWWIDGPVEEMYRYGLDVAKLDFIAQADHGIPNVYMLRHYPSMMLQADLYLTSAFVPLYGYEWSPARYDGVGHHNIISWERHPYPGDVNPTQNEVIDMRALYNNLIAGTSIAIPHTSGKTTHFVNDWAVIRDEDLYDPDFYRVTEIFQGATSSFEDVDAPSPFTTNANDVDPAGTTRTMLEQDVRMGFIASSDHWSNFLSFAVVYATDRSREAIFEALNSRRCYATTSRDLLMEFWVEDRPMGSEITSEAGEITIRGWVSGPRNILNVSIMKDGVQWASEGPGVSEFSGEWTDADYCGHSYYMRVILEDDIATTGHMAWSSPVWVDCKTCQNSGQCDDGDECNGAETCNAEGYCESGPITDCNANESDDACDISSEGSSKDCNGNAIPDECDLASGADEDCNGNGVPDLCDVNLSEFEGFDAAVLLTFAGQQPTCVIAADLDLDGDQDLAITKQLNDSVVLFLNDGFGVFSTGASLTVGTRPEVVAAVDLNGDLAPELVTTDIVGDTVTVRINQGDGTFGAAVSFDTGDAPNGLDFADFDGDGDLDGVNTNRLDETVSIMRNDGSGSLAQTIVLATGTTPYDVVAADLDGVLGPDFAVVNGGTDDVSVYLNLGDGTFAPEIRVPTGNEPLAIASADMDGDGDMDLLTADFSADTVSVLLNNGDATFVLAQAVSADDEPNDVECVDLNNDGDVDCVVTNFATNTVVTLINDGTGTLTKSGSFAVGNGARSVATGLLNDDDVRDVVAVNFWANSASVLFNHTVPKFSEDCNGDGRPDECPLAAGDLDGNDVVDLLDHALLTGLLTGPCSPAPCDPPLYPDPLCPSGDFDLDGDVDLADFVTLQAAFAPAP